jgi:phage tail protein X
MAQEIEEVLEGYPLLLSLLIQEVSEEIKDNEGNIIETKVQKYLRTDNLDTLKTIMIKYIYFKVKNLEEAVKQANETIAKIKYVLVNKEVATEEELV